MDNLHRKNTNSSVMFSSATPDQFRNDEFSIDSLKRCKKCILPETMPFIKFDNEGVCNYCRNYRKLDVKGKDVLWAITSKYRKKNGEADCLVGISGGRDSVYGLHYIKNILKMNPVAFTYDWGMATSLAHRNISRICDKLGVKHILASSDISQKRSFIKKNVTAWLKKPDLGMIPLFMAGGHEYFYHANKLKKQTGVEVVFLCENVLERTDFKTGFAGIKPEYIDEDYHYSLSLLNKIKIAAFFSKQHLLNPSYLNSSIPDTLFAYACYYLIKRDYLNLYRFIHWNEEEIVSTLISEYNWEVATDTKSTWRIGDGTAAFYNYIYYTVAGFTENDTFRSNQIRAGLITREDALNLVREENRHRFESIKWYLETIDMDLDLEDVFKTINSIQKLY